MRVIHSLCGLLVLAAAAAAAAAPALAQAPARAPFPAPGTPAVWRDGGELADALRAASIATPAQGVAQVLATDRTAFSLMRRTQPNNPLAHAGWTEVFYIVEGGGLLESGGTVTRNAAGEVTSYTGTVERRVKLGDVVVIPEGTPHRFRTLDGGVTYLEVRFPNEPGEGPAPSSRAAPAAGTAVMIYDGEGLYEALENGARSPGSQATVPVMETDRYVVSLIRRGVSGRGAASPGWNEVNYILAGAGTFVSGGRLTAPGPEPLAVIDGVPQRIRPGDVLVIPADTPQQFTGVDDFVTYFQVRMPNAAPRPRP